MYYKIFKPLTPNWDLRSISIGYKAKICCNNQFYLVEIIQVDITNHKMAKIKILEEINESFYIDKTRTFIASSTDDLIQIDLVYLYEVVKNNF